METGKQIETLRRAISRANSLGVLGPKPGEDDSYCNPGATLRSDALLPRDANQWAGGSQNSTTKQNQYFGLGSATLLKASASLTCDAVTPRNEAIQQSGTH